RSTPRSHAMHPAPESSRNEEALDPLARKAASMKRGWTLHATVYLTMNLVLAALTLHHGRQWEVSTPVGWGLGLLIHGIVIWLALPASGLYNWRPARERQCLQRRPH